jgi:hypothetical protein
MVSFTDNSSPLPTSWNWSFGDGSPNSNLQNPSHTYTAAGQYAVFLIVNNATCSDTITFTITIQNNCATFGLTAAFSLPADTIYLNGLGMVTPVNTSANSDAWLWNFGDGSTSTEQSPTHVYATIGTYTITLTSYNHNCTSSVTKVIVVIEKSNGINELHTSDDEIKLQIYPNPSGGKFTVQLENCNECLEKIEDLTVINILGEIVFRASDINSQSMVIDLSKHPKGIYFIKLLLPKLYKSDGDSRGANDYFGKVLVKKVIVN